MAVKKWGTGRKDYSEMVELATVPIVRSHQLRWSATTGFFLPPGEWATWTDWPSEIMQFFNFTVTCNENVLVSIGLSDDYPDTQSNTILKKFGYGQAKITIPKGYKFDLRNMQSPSITGNYSGWPIYLFGNHSDHAVILRVSFQALGSAYA